MKVVAIIPVREFRSAKIRLSRHLDGTERSALTRSMLIHVASSLDNSCAARTLVVASDAKAVSRVLAPLRKVEIIQEKIHHGGVNSAVEDGIAHAIAHVRGLSSFMILPSDLPYLTSNAVNEAISKLGDYDLVICPSQRYDGTSLLAFNLPHGRITIHYDDDSYMAHIMEAKARKLRYFIIRSRQAFFDIDEWNDLTRLKSRFRTTSLRKLLWFLEKGN